MARDCLGLLVWAWPCKGKGWAAEIPSRGSWSKFRDQAVCFTQTGTVWEQRHTGADFLGERSTRASCLVAGDLD